MFVRGHRLRGHAALARRFTPAIVPGGDVGGSGADRDSEPRILRLFEIAGVRGRETAGAVRVAVARVAAGSRGKRPGFVPAVSVVDHTLAAAPGRVASLDR